MAGLASICPHRSPPSSSLCLSSTTAHDYGSSCCVALTSPIGGSTLRQRPGQRLYSQRVPIGLKIQNAATKPAKSPAEEEWKVKRELLLQKKVRSVDVKEALRLQQENNFVILDVRPEAEFKEAHPPGAINVQIYRLIKEWTAWDIARRAAFAFFGIFSGTEENPEFLQSVESKISKDAKIIVACSAGGTMKPSQNLPEGQQSRSLIAAYFLVLNGYTNVFHLEGGLNTWFKEGLPAVSEE
ncbi:rhodanese-like domain-containing protein 14, chloroplastic [Punica granatum]|uniref:Rhodanese-like domain-containing protein 14, chloroplastic n=2 Tax=Punica granatum TaxID=22663 RepID=A0A6P8CFL1_PUNGR|nr:rhodanese-like domain-containing protein 14, chloroplastic [Punica granatum]PKI76410.1 hypothetical protein CRG98_003205 [Punica granatum]